MSIHNSYSYSLKERELNFINRLLDKAPTFEYVGGYKNSESKVLLKCKICGTYKEVTAQCVRKGHQNILCNSCLDYMKYLDREKQYREKRINKFIKDYNITNNKEINNILNRFEKNRVYISKCKYCNNEILSTTNKEVCDKCRSKKDKHSYKSLKKLYKRDKGICYICGGKCDYEDYIIKGNTIVCGNYYPSIDHIIPISKGGTDDWNNLKLAHRICNSLKRDNGLY